MTSDTDYGPQYAKDDPFKASMRLRQSRFRVEELGVSQFRTYGSRLPTDAALAGLNFYLEWPGLLDAVDARFGRRDKKLYWDMLASDHAPFNFLFPLGTMAAGARVVGELIDREVARVKNVRFEYAPKPRERYLDDNTSFDAYIEYVGSDGISGGVGIEVKITEGPYSWEETERTRMFDEGSVYNRLSRSRNLYVDGAAPSLRTRELKQLWRNQLLGEAMLDLGELSPMRFTSLLLMPSGNTHYVDAAQRHVALLAQPHQMRFRAVTFEAFIATCARASDAPEVVAWLGYLSRRYITGPAATNRTGQRLSRGSGSPHTRER